LYIILFRLIEGICLKSNSDVFLSKSHDPGDVISTYLYKYRHLSEWHHYEI